MYGASSIISSYHCATGGDRWYFWHLMNFRPARKYRLTGFPLMLPQTRINYFRWNECIDEQTATTNIQIIISLKLLYLLFSQCGDQLLPDYLLWLNWQYLFSIWEYVIWEMVTRTVLVGNWRILVKLVWIHRWTHQCSVSVSKRENQTNQRLL